VPANLQLMFQAEQLGSSGLDLAEIREDFTIVETNVGGILLRAGRPAGKWLPACALTSHYRQ
jgi:hypothetical protein